MAFKLKNNFREWFTLHESFVVRNPLFPVDTFYEWTTQTAAPKEHLRKYLRDFYSQPVAQEAIYIGSPDLHEQLLLWLDNKTEKAEKRDKTELSLVKYMIRMCTRCTPYGLFASCTPGETGDTSGIRLSGEDSLSRKGRLDMDYVCEVHTHILKQKDISNQLLFFPNSSLYVLGDQLRFIEHRFRENSGRSYHLVQVDSSDYLEKILQLARSGQTPLQLAAAISGEDVTEPEALEFVYELISNQVLVSEMEPAVTGEEYFHALLRKLKTLHHTENFVSQFEKVLLEFKNLGDEAVGEKQKIYSNIVAHLKLLDVPLHIKTLIQVDSYRPAQCSVTRKVQEELLLGASLLQWVSGDNPGKDAFTDFRNAFRNRYESQWVPLVEVLDTESGIGFGKFDTSGMEESPLIDKLPLGNGQANHQQVPDAETYKWQLYQEALAAGKREVMLDNFLEELLKKEVKPDGLPDSISMMVKIHASSAEELDNGNYSMVLHAPYGPSGANLLGRFCHLHPAIEKLTSDVLRAEEAHHPDCIYAEIVHLPESRIGNILMRPVLREYEIPYLCGTSLPGEFQVPVTDLQVRVDGDTVVLRSKKLNKRIIPRLSTAHNFNQSTLPVYQFLCDLQFQHMKHVGWSWGILDNRPFLPRVSYKKFILSRARWILTREEVKDFEKKNDEELLSAFASLQKTRNIPAFILLAQGDNELLMHLENVFCLRLLLNELNKSTAVMLTESLDSPGQCWMKSPRGNHSGEFIFTFSKKILKKNQSSPVPHPIESPEPVKRIFPVGSEWLYAKIYCGTKTAEKILSEVLKPFTEELMEENRIARYFFLRYRDEGGNHIRIRFRQANDPSFWKHIIDRLRSRLHPLVDNHTVHNIQYETYQREVERYGFDTMEISETIFHFQSRCVLNFISLLDGDEGEQYRWQIALKAVDMILDDFRYSLPEKRDLVKSLHKNFTAEFSVKAPEQKKISERFGSNKKIIHYVMNEGGDEDENLQKGIGAFVIADEIYHDAIARLAHAPSIGNQREPMNRLMGSYLHMFVNRLFVSNQRKVELVIYDYLLKYYESRLAIEKNKKAAPAEVVSGS